MLWAMELEVIGCVTTAPTAQEACSAYLVSEGDTRVLLDCGPGSLQRLMERQSGRLALDAIVVTHLHQDHCLDLLPAAGVVLLQRRTASGASTGKMPLLVPPSGRQCLQSLAAVFEAPGQGEFRDSFRHAFEIEEYAQPSQVKVGALTLHFSAPLNHEVPCSAIRAEHQGKSICYSGDTAPCSAIVEHAAGCDVFLCEATFPHPMTNRQYLHLCPEEAGDIARTSGVKQLVLTHFVRSVPEWHEQMKQAATTAYLGPVETASRGKRF